MATLSRLYDFQPETVIRSQEVDDELNQILAEINGNLDTVNIADLAITAAKIAALAVGTGHLADDAVTNDKLGNDAVDTINVQDEAITNAKLGLLSVQPGNIAEDAVTTLKIADLAVSSVKIANSAITNSKLATGAVTADKIQNNSISGDKIIDGSITTDEIDDGAVTSIKIADNNVIGTKLPSNVITTIKINNGAVTNDKIGSGAVTDVKILDNAIGSGKLQNGAVITDKINNLAVTSAKIADSNVTSVKIQGGAVTNDKLGSHSVEYLEINQNVAGVGLAYDNLNPHFGLYLDYDTNFFLAAPSLTLRDGSGSTSGITKAKMMPVEIEPATLLLASTIGTNAHNSNVRQGLVGFDVVLKNSDSARYSSGTQWANGEWNIGDGIIIDSWNEGDYVVSYQSWLDTGHLFGETFLLSVAINNVEYITKKFTVMMDHNDVNMDAVWAVAHVPIEMSVVIPDLTNGDVVNFKANLLSDTSHVYAIRLAWSPGYAAEMAFHRITFSQP